MEFLKKITDRQIGFALLGFGVGSMILAYVRTRSPFTILPDVDGVLACGVVGFFACLWQGLGYRRALSTMAPIVAVQLASCIRTRANPFMIAGVEGIIFGITGIVLTTLALAGEDETPKPEDGEAEAAT